MANENEEKVVEAKAEKAEPKKEQKNVTMALGTLSVILSLCSLGVAILCKILWEFGVALGVANGIFFIIACGLGVFAAVLSIMESKQKFTLSLGLAVFAVFISFIAL